MKNFIKRSEEIFLNVNSKNMFNLLMISISKIYKNIKKNYYISTIFLLLFFIFLFSCANLILEGPLIWGDYSYISKSSNLFLFNNILYLWGEASFGTSIRSSLGNIVALTVTNIPFISDKLIFISLRLSPVFFILLSTYHVTFSLFKNKNIALLTAIFSIVNPVIFGDFLNGQTLWIYFPILYLIYYTIRIFYHEEFNKKNCTIFALLLSCTIVFLPPMIVPLFFIVGLFILLSFLQTRDLSLVWKRISAILFVVLVFSLLINPLFITSSSGQDAFPGSESLNDYYHNYSKTNLINTIRLAGNRGNGQEKLGYNNLNSYNIFGYFFIIIVLFALYSNYSKRKSYHVLLIIGLSFSILSILGFLELLSINKNFGYFVFNSNLVGSTIRNPTKVYVILLQLSLIVFGLSLYIIRDALSEKINKKIYVMLIISILIYGRPIFGGDFGLSKNRPLNEYKKDPIVASIVSQSNNGVGRSILIPSDHQDELNFQGVGLKLNTFRLGGAYPDTQRFQNALKESFDSQDDIFFHLLNIGSIDRIYLKNKNEYGLYKKFLLFGSNKTYESTFDFLQKNLSDVNQSMSYTEFLNNESLPLVTSFVNLVSINSSDYLLKNIDFIKNYCKNGSRFMMINGDYVNNIYADSVHILYQSFWQKNYNQNVFEETLNIFNKSELFFDKGKKVIKIYNNQSTIQIFKEDDDSLKINGIGVTKNSTKELIELIPINNQKKYFAMVGSQLIPVDKNNDSDLGAIKKTFDILSVNAEENLVKNPSFEDGSWQNTVSDCNRYDDNGKINMIISQQEKSDENQSIELQATNHIACISQGNIIVNGGHQYLLKFDYQSPNGKLAGFNISFENQSYEINEKIPINQKEWQAYQKIINVPENATNIRLTIYSFSDDNQKNIITRYDNFYFSQLEMEKKVNPEYKRDIQKIELAQKQSTLFKYDIKKNINKNLIQNASFEEGLWSNLVEDCNKYDDAGDLNMMRAQVGSDGNFSLELQSKRHNACSKSDIIPVVEEKEYILSFDYQSPNGKQVGYYILFNDPKKSSFQEKILVTDKDWKNFSKKIRIPESATTASLIVYSYEEDKKTNIITRYDNFKFVELPDIENRYYLVSDLQTNFVEPRKTTFDLINPTKKLVHIKGASTPFYLAVSESYHLQWQAQLTNGKIEGFFDSWVPWVRPDRIADDKHFELDGFLNGWFVEPEILCANNNKACTKNEDGSYDMEMTVEFFPQRWFYLGLLISGATFFGCISYLGWSFLRRKKEHRSSSRIADLRGGTYSTKGAQRLNSIGVAHYDRQILPREDTRRANLPKKRI